ncbi:helix-turn-helix domain-containing protein [Streptomyces sp. NPDC002248]
MDHRESAEPVSVIGERVKALRRRKGLTGAELGNEVTALGLKWDRSIVANVENGRRQSVSVGELLALSIVLDVAPVNLLIPPAGGRYRPAPTVEYDADTVRAWVRGFTPLPGTDTRTFYTETPADEWRDPDLPARAETENEVSRYLVLGMDAARRAGLSLETVLSYIENQWKASDALERGPDGEGV